MFAFRVHLAPCLAAGVRGWSHVKQNTPGDPLFFFHRRYAGVNLSDNGSTVPGRLPRTATPIRQSTAYCFLLVTPENRVVIQSTCANRAETNGKTLTSMPPPMYVVKPGS